MSSQSYNVSKDAEKGSDHGTAEESKALTGKEIELQATSVPGTNAGKPAPKTLMGKLRAKKEESSNCVLFMFGCCCIVCGSCIGAVIIGIIQCIPIAMIVIGSIYLHDCPRQRLIPIYLIVAGCCVISLSLLKALRQHCCKKDDDDNDKVTKQDVKKHPLEMLLFLFGCAWFIAGSVWIYSIHKDFDSEDATDEKYCHPVLYWFSFWMTTVQYILLALCIPFMICCCCGILMHLCSGTTADEKS